MSTPAARRRAALWFALLAILLLLGLASGNFRHLLAEAARGISPLAVLATLPGQVAASLLCGLALWALRPGVGFGASLASRLLRDAGDNLLVFLPGLGEVIGARALVLAGGKTRAAIAASALDKAAETLAQVPYMALAALVFWQGWSGEMPPVGQVLWLAAGALAVLGACAVLVRTGAHWAPVRRLRAEWEKFAAEASSRKGGLPLSTLLHFVAWIMGGIQIWMAARALGYDIGLYEAVAIESAAYAGRTLLFMVPAGLGAQEAGLVAAGLVFGLSPAQSLALGLAMRLRDLVFGLPLLIWPLAEYRNRRNRLNAGEGQI